MASKCIRSQLPLLINNTPDIILSKMDTHSLQGYSFFIKQYYLSQYITQCQERGCIVCSNWLNRFQISKLVQFIFLQPNEYHITLTAIRYVGIAIVMISIHNLHHSYFITSYHHHHLCFIFIEKCQWLKTFYLTIFILYSGLDSILMVQYRRQRETHNSGFCLNGLPSTQ